ncbi:hypothetical protein HCA58_18210 [Micromonospora sp. HNM0581]|nr:hypothetical protein [Micromonospora sp. HNM0581]
MVAAAGPVPRRGVDVPGDPVRAAWADYLAAARQLDGVRRDAATAAGEQARVVQAAREELAGVRGRLVSQESRLRELGVSPISLAPTPPELAEATRSMSGGPAAVLTALRDARRWAVGADDTLAARGLSRVAHWPAHARNLLVYGPLALVGPVLLVVVWLLSGTGAVTMLAVLVGLPAPAVAFGLGWLAVGRCFPPGPGGRMDRTPRFGALTCLVPAVVVNAGIVLAMLSS